MLFTFGYGYVAFFVALEQLARRKALPLPAATPSSERAAAEELAAWSGRWLASASWDATAPPRRRAVCERESQLAVVAVGRRNALRRTPR